MQTLNTAYVNRILTQGPIRSGPLTGLKFAVKDVFSVKNYVTGLGNPKWQAAHLPATRNAQVIDRLRAAGATLVGITISDEFMYSIKGSNVHYGDPLNVKYPSCFSGGSSSGSASAVAAGDVDFALGTDTGGSIRVPASYCGLYGFRPTHRADLLAGVAPLAESFDTVGILANRADVLEKVGRTLYPDSDPLNVRKIYYLKTNILASNEDDYLQTVTQIREHLQIPAGNVRAFSLPEKFGLEHLRKTFKNIQGYEAWQHYGKWVQHHPADLGADIAAHFRDAQKVQDDENLMRNFNLRQHFIEFMNDFLSDQALLVLPTTSSKAPKKDTDFSAVESIRQSTQQLTSLAGMAGIPQVAIPIPTGSISIIAKAHTDRALLKVAARLGGDFSLDNQE